MSEVAVLVGDLVGSREASDRQQLQAKLARGLEGINNTEDGDAIAPMEIIRGDEFEGGFSDPASCLEAFFSLERTLFPVRFKAGIGIGSISTPDEKSISRMDGPAFHRARSAIEKAQSSTANLLVASSDHQKDDLLNTILDLIFLIKENWTDRQWEIVNYYQNHRDRTQAEIAFQFGISQPAVAKVLQRTRCRHIESAKEILAKELKGYVN